MRKRMSPGIIGALVLAVCWSLIAPRLIDAQDASNPESAPRVVLKTLHTLVYPPIARQAAITGDVTVSVTLHADGTVDSVTPVTGHSLLAPAVLDSAKQSTFECVHCGNSGATALLTYSFALTPGEKTDPCCCSRHSSASVTSPHISQSGNHVTITAAAAPVCVCPDSCAVKWADEQSHVRSPKCLYLWKCGHKMIYID